MGIRNPTMIRNQAELGENNTAAVDKMYDVETLPKNKTQFFRLRMSDDKVCSEFWESSFRAANKRARISKLSQKT